MECNREEAIRVLDLAEKKFKEGQYECAVRFARKAQKLFPSLPNLTQTLTAYQVHLAAVTRRLASGEANWHAVLGVDPSADHDTMRKQFRKMCLLTHPDKNSLTAAADGAFKLVNQAWEALSSPNNAAPASPSSAAEEEKNYTNEDESESEAETYEDDDEEEEVWEDLEAQMKCQRSHRCRFWEFRRLGDKYLEHKCKNCMKWGGIWNKLACVDVPLPCKECDRNLIWGSYRPTGFECRSCDSYYVVGVNPDWMPRSLRSRSSRFRPGTVSCPYCESLNKYKQEDGGGDGRFATTVSISCKCCGIRSFIEMETEDINERYHRRR